jgi:hypothetical protein
LLQNAIEYVATLDAYILGWVTIDLIANLLLKKEETGTKIQFLGARWLKRKDAIIVAFLQFLIAFSCSFFINDFFLVLFSKALLYIVPITFIAIGILYLYILLGLPYKITVRRCAFSIILFLLAIALLYFISKS